MIGVSVEAYGVVRKLRSIGSKAMLEDIAVTVIGLQVQMGCRVVYEVVWVLDNVRRVEWVEEVELRDKT